MKVKYNFKKGIVLCLSLAMTMQLLPAMSVQAGNGTVTEPSVSFYATKQQLMDDTFTPDASGGMINCGKIIFGKNAEGTAQKWYVLGADSGLTDDVGDNTIIFADSAMTTGQFNSSTSVWTSARWADCTYPEGSSPKSSVMGGHYGASTLRDTLQAMADGSDTTYFTLKEQALINSTTVTTYDYRNDVNYTTTDKLYALTASGADYTITSIQAGSSNQILLVTDDYWNSDEKFWLRRHAANEAYAGYTYISESGNYVYTGYVTGSNGIRPASNLNLQSVLFASAAQAAVSGTTSNTIADEAMTLRFDGADKNIGAALYNTTTGDIRVVKGAATGNVALIVQGYNGVDWYYSKLITGTDTIKASDIKSALALTSDIDLSHCKIWLETTDDGMLYAVDASETEISSFSISSVEITDIDAPEVNMELDTSASCKTAGVSSISSQVTWEPDVTKAGYNINYIANITLEAATFYEFANSVAATVNGETATDVKVNEDGTVTVTYEFPATAKRKIESVTAPTAPDTFTTYYAYDGYDVSPIGATATELGTQANVKYEGTLVPTNEDMDVTWSIADGDYDKTPGGKNIFRWTISADALADYDASECDGYDANTGTITGVVTITNKAATPVSTTGTDSSIPYTGETIDVSNYFEIDSNAGAATYSLVTQVNDATGEGSLEGSILTVTKTGTFKIKLNTAAQGIYAADERIITLTVENGTIDYTATDYSGTYDGQEHSILVNVNNPEGTTVTYSVDGINYESNNPVFRDEGTHTVYYQLAKDNYTSIIGTKTVTINKKSVSVTAQGQEIVWGNDIDQNSYDTNGFVNGDRITQIKLIPNTSSLTENGTITISDIKIENSTYEDVTGNYDIIKKNGLLKIVHDTTLPPKRIEADKDRTTYKVGETLNVDDITVMVYYEDGYSEAVTDFTTNADSIDMQTPGNKILTVSYTNNAVTKTDDIGIVVELIEYEILNGEESDWTFGSDGEILIRGKGEFSKFVGVYLDGTLLDAKNYTVKEGSTIIALKAAYLNTLSVGTHTFEIRWTDGFAKTTFTIREEAAQTAEETVNGESDSSADGSEAKEAVSPKTGDTTLICWMFLLLIFSGMGAVLMLGRKKPAKIFSAK